MPFIHVINDATDWYYKTLYWCDIYDKFCFLSVKTFRVKIMFLLFPDLKYIWTTIG